jgi:hypothetical protein
MLADLTLSSETQSVVAGCYEVDEASYYGDSDQSNN